MTAVTLPSLRLPSRPLRGEALSRRLATPLSLLLSAVLIAGCAPMGGSKAPRLDATGASVKGVYPVTTANIDAVRQRAVQSLNERRGNAGLAPVVMDANLVTAADRGSYSMSVQKRAWLFGEDGSTPTDRARQAGFSGALIGEVVSETWENEIQTLNEWMRSPAQRAILMDPNARRMGVGVHQEESMKLWWTVNLGD